MKPNSQFLKLPKHFWADVRIISQAVGYTERVKHPRQKKGEPKQADPRQRATGPIKVPTLDEIRTAYKAIDLTARHLTDEKGQPTEFGQRVLAYFSYRASVLNDTVRPRLMDVAQAKGAFDRLAKKRKSSCPLPMNKQKGEKKSPAYFTCIINMLIEANAQGLPCDFDPRQLTTITLNGAPLRTLARRIDGAFPGPVNPIAVWEIKEYYYTTTFGSRVADGVYESLLDGMELEELRKEEGIDVKHYLMVDDRFTWWDCGRSYLCRIIDMLHMGYVDEVLFGKEVLDRMPVIVREWLEIAAQRPRSL